MKFLSQGRYALAGFNRPMKISLSFFIIFILLGLASSLALAHQQTSFEAKRAEQYYLGNENDPDATEFYVAKSYRQLLETTHFHLYIMPVIYLAFIHLYFLSSRSEREKSLLAALTFTSLLLEVATPWLVRFVSGKWAALFWISGIGITVPTLWMSLVCLKEMWSPKRSEPNFEI